MSVVEVSGYCDFIILSLQMWCDLIWLPIMAHRDGLRLQTDYVAFLILISSDFC